MCQKRNPQHPPPLRRRRISRPARHAPGSRHGPPRARGGGARASASFPLPGVARRPRITAGAAWSWKGGGWQAARRALFERRWCLSRGNGREICLPINKSGPRLRPQGEVATARRTRLPVPGADATDRCRCAMRFKFENHWSKGRRGSGTSQRGAVPLCHQHQPKCRALVGWCTPPASA
jgi:hypothetical protein